MATIRRTGTWHCPHAHSFTHTWLQLAAETPGTAGARAAAWADSVMMKDTPVSTTLPARQGFSMGTSHVCAHSHTHGLPTPTPQVLTHLLTQMLPSTHIHKRADPPTHLGTHTHSHRHSQPARGWAHAHSHPRYYTSACTRTRTFYPVSTHAGAQCSTVQPLRKELSWRSPGQPEALNLRPWTASAMSTVSPAVFPGCQVGLLASQALGDSHGRSYPRKKCAFCPHLPAPAGVTQHPEGRRQRLRFSTTLASKRSSPESPGPRHPITEA